VALSDPVAEPPPLESCNSVYPGVRSGEYSDVILGPVRRFHVKRLLVR